MYLLFIWQEKHMNYIYYERFFDQIYHRFYWACAVDINDSAISKRSLIILVQGNLGRNIEDGWKIQEMKLEILPPVLAWLGVGCVW